MNCEKRKRNYKRALAILLAAVLSITCAHPVQAADDPFAWVPDSKKEVLTTGKQLIFQIGYGEYKASAVSSNPKAVPVRITAGGVNVVLEPKKPGKATITIKAKKGKKVYKKKCKVTFLKYVNPFSKLKIGGKNYTSKLKKKSDLNLNKAYLNGKVSYKLKKGYTIQCFEAYRHKKGSVYGGDVSDGDTLPKNTEWIRIVMTNKQGVEFTMWIISKTYRKQMGW